VVTAQTPVIAFTGTWPVSILQTSQSGGNWTFDILCQGGTATGNYYIFDKVQAGSQRFSAAIGIELFDPITGAPTFRSDLKYMRVVSVQTMEMPTPLKFGTAQTQALGRAGLAAVIGNPGGRVVATNITVIDPVTGLPDSSTQYTPYQLAVAVNGTNLLYGSNDTRFTTVNEGNDQLDVPCTVIVIDLSNF
jgi:hypothetical protein